MTHSLNSTRLFAKTGSPWIAVCMLALACVANGLAMAQEHVVRLASADLSISKTNPPEAVAASGATTMSRWPIEHEAGQFLIHSTVARRQYESQLQSLSDLPRELSTALRIPITEETIHVVILESREALDSYVHRVLPSAPSRPALYIRHRGPGLVLTYFHARWIEDVRHECTHALLDASHLKLPVWLDEGLAEYFETPGENPIQHPRHCKSVRSQLRYGQVAELERLEQLGSNADLTPKDYRDAWSVVALMLNASAGSRTVFCDYLKDLQEQRAAGLLSRRRGTSGLSWRDEYLQFYK
jgi:hypothetical protein